MIWEGSHVGIWCNVKFSLLFLLFNAVKTDTKLTLFIQYGEIFYYLTNQDKIKNLEGYIFKKFLGIKNK